HLRLEPAESATRMSTGDRDARAAVCGAGYEYADKCVTSCRIQKLKVRRLPDHGECCAGDDFSRLEDRTTVTAVSTEKLCRCDLPLSCVYRCAECEAGGGIVGGGFVGGEGTTQRASVAHGGISDVAHQICQDR